MLTDIGRRNFLLQSCTGISAVWISSNFPALLSAAKHARDTAQSAAPKLTFFTPDQAIEMDAITSRIIPTDDTPGAHEAGVVYFIDRALKTFAVDEQKNYRAGLSEIAARTKELFPSLDKFSAATPEEFAQTVPNCFGLDRRRIRQLAEQRYSPERMTRAYIDVYEKACASKAVMTR